MSRAWSVLFLIPWIVALGVLFWLGETRIPFTGIRELSFDFDGRSVWFDPFLPGQRVTPIGPQEGGWTGQRIFEEPVYTSLRLPGVYRRADIGLVFRPVRQPVIEMGVRQEPDPFFEIQPFWSEALSRGWRRVEFQGRTGYVRESESDAALGEQDPDRLLVWHASTTAPLWMDELGSERVFPAALRGSHDIQLVPTNGSIQIRFLVQDMNRRRDKGSVIFSLSKDGDLIWSEALSLAGSRDAKPSSVYEKSLKIENRSAGVYKLSITADDDIFIRQITTPLRHWVIGPRLYFGDQVGYATTTLPGIAWTNARHLLLKTFHEEGRQKVTLGSSMVNVLASHQEYRLDRSLDELSGPKLLTAPKGDIRIVGDGYFALAPDLLFLPSPRRLTDASDPVREGIRAILTPYKAPLPLGDGWYEASFSQSLANRPSPLRLTIGAPGLNERKSFIDVRAIHLVYTRSGINWREWFRALWGEMAAAWHAL